MTDSDWVQRFASAPTMEALPAVVAVAERAPANPPPDIQQKFVGASYEAAYAEAKAFVDASDDRSARLGLGHYQDLTQILDFGSGWGRISRLLLTSVKPTAIFALDVDPEMTALVDLTLPGVNAVTGGALPPSPFRDRSMDAAVAFSVFSHLSGPAHEAWATEFGRLVRTGGAVAITVLDASFIELVASTQTAVAQGTADAFAASLAPVFPDAAAARAGFAAGEIQYGGTGGGEVRTGDFYGWAAAPRAYVERVWGAAGFDVVDWVEQNVLFPQCLVTLVRRPDPAPSEESARTQDVPVSGSVSGSERRAQVGRLVKGAGRRLNRAGRAALNELLGRP